MSDAKKPLPPLPAAPKRSLSPPAQRSIGWTLDDATPAKNERMPHMAAVLTLCDRLDFQQLSALADLLETWGQLTPHEQVVVAVAARQLLEKRG